MTRREILDAAIRCVCGDRDEQYGTPEKSFEQIADLWSWYLGQDVSALDVSVMMTLFKIARIKTGIQKDDSYIDAAGYIACAGEIADGSSQRS